MIEIVDPKGAKLTFRYFRQTLAFRRNAEPKVVYEVSNDRKKWRRLTDTELQHTLYIVGNVTGSAMRR